MPRWKHDARMRSTTRAPCTRSNAASAVTDSWQKRSRLLLVTKRPPNWRTSSCLSKQYEMATKLPKNTLLNPRHHDIFLSKKPSLLKTMWFWFFVVLATIIFVFGFLPAILDGGATFVQWIIAGFWLLASGFWLLACGHRLCPQKDLPVSQGLTIPPSRRCLMASLNLGISVFHWIRS